MIGKSRHFLDYSRLNCWQGHSPRCIMPSDSEVFHLRNWLKAKDIFVPDDWVSACLEWISSENPGVKESSKLNKMVYEQWLFTNLRDLSSQSLPNTINDNVTSLSGRHCLQIESITDISKSKHTLNANSKYTDIPSTAATQNKWDKKAARMLMMTLSDGSQSISAIETEHIPCLNDSVPLGVKVHIKGPVKCRRGVMLLISDHISMLGGEVEEFNEANANGSERQTINNNQSDAMQSVVEQHQPAASNCNTVPKSSFTQSGSNDRPVPRANGAIKQEPDFISLLSDDDDDEIIQCLEESEAQSAPSLHTLAQDPVMLLSDGEDEEMIECLEKIESSQSKEINLTNAASHSNTESKNLFLSHGDMKPVPSRYLCHCEKYLSEKVHCIKVKAIVTTLLSSLKHDSETGWLLKALICDGTASIETTFSHDVLQSLLGLSDENPSDIAARPELKKKLGNFRNTIMSVCHFMDIVLSGDSASGVFATVTKIFDLL